MGVVYTTLMALGIIVYLSLVVLWIVAECKWSKRIRISLGTGAVIFAIPINLFITITASSIGSNWYYSTALKTIVTESIYALEYGETDFIDRLKSLDSSFDIMYGSNQDLLTTSRLFQKEGEQIRSARKTKTSNTPKVCVVKRTDSNRAIFL